MKKGLLLIAVTLTMLFSFPKAVFAEINPYAFLDNTSYSILKELDRVTEYDEQGLPIIHLETANEIGLSGAAMEVALNLNRIVAEIKSNGESSTFTMMERALFPIGSYGNYCGMGNKGWHLAPIDDLDSACKEHDKCFKGFTSDNRSCNKAFLKRLLPIIQVNSGLTTKGAYALAAYKLFAHFV